MQERLPVRWDFSRWAWCRLSRWMRMRRQQFYTLDHPFLAVVIEPILPRLEAGRNRMPGYARMF